MEENGEDSYAMQTEENMEDSKESHDAEEDVQNSKKRGRKKAASEGQVTPKKPENKEPTTPVTDRPARERKSIDRFADSVEKEKEKPKEFKIEQGSGTCLRDIPNVVFKLSKRKWSDESVQLLHKLLYNRRVKPHLVKANILQFSGCVWGANEEKEKSKMKEKLEKCVKENLFQVSDLLDLNITKTTKKEDLVLRVFEFLDCPHKTTEKLVQEEEQRLREKKRNKTPTKGKRKKSPGQTPRKRQKHDENEEVDQEVDDDDHDEDVPEEHEEESEEVPEEVPVKKKRSIKIKEPSRDAKPSSTKKPGKKAAKKPSESEDVEEDPEEPVEEAEEVEKEPEEDNEEPKRKRSKNKKYDDDDVVSKSPPKKSVRKSVKKKSVYEPDEEDLDDNVKDVKSKPLSKVSKKQEPKEAAKTPVGSTSKEKKKAGSTSGSSGPSKVFSRKKKKEEPEEAAPQEIPKKGRGTSQSAVKEDSKATPIPPDEDLRAAICELLRDADFSTVTFTDVVKQLGAKFNVDLSQNKAHVKNLIQEEISKIVDEDDGEGDNEDEETGVDTPDKEEKEPVETAAED
eukprot:c24806_g1_i1 orf=354-2054(+)